MRHLDPHERPPDSIRNVYKKYQKMKLQDMDQDEDIIDLSSDASTSCSEKVRVVKEYTAENLTAIFRSFAGEDGSRLQATDLPQSIPVYEHADMPGLHILPSLLPPPLQSTLLSRLLHRDLSSPSHLTNIHTHYSLSYPSSSSSSSSSFFSLPPSTPSPIAVPLNPDLHKPLTVSQLLGRKLRWTTLGGQYDWTAKQYPNTPPPLFPQDVKELLEAIFPQTRAEAAIVNFYSRGDTLSVHRDVAEKSATGLVSVSLGCDALFVLGMEGREDGGEEDKIVTLRLRSGSAVYMSGESRFAWHGVPQIIGGTCPEYLREWPATAEGEEGGEYEAWRAWMANKRVNLNVRQMWD